MHRTVLDDQGYAYRFGNAFFRHSTFKVFEMQGHYESYQSYPRDVVKGKFKLQKEVDAALRAGEKRVFTDIAFVTEAPAESAGSAEPVCTPFFCRLVWDSERANVALCRGRLHLQTTTSFSLLGHIIGLLVGKAEEAGSSYIDGLPASMPNRPNLHLPAASSRSCLRFPTPPSASTNIVRHCPPQTAPSH